MEGWLQQDFFQYSMTTWPTKKLGEVCDFFTDGDWIESKDQSNAGIRLIQTGNIGEGMFLDKSGRARFVSEDTFKRLNCTEIFPGDFLISRLPDPVGRSCILPNTGSRMITAVDCTIVRVNPKLLLPQYILLFTQSREYYQQIEQQLSGSTRQRISRGNLGKIQIPLPPLAEQKKIVERIQKQFAKIDEAIRLREQSLAATEALLPATLHEIFEEGKQKGWKVSNIGDLCVVSSGGTPSKSVIKYWEGGDVPWLRSEACKDEVVEHAYKFITRDGLKHSSARMFNPRTTLIALVGATIGRTGFLMFESSTNQNIAGLFPKDEDELLPEYLFVVARGLYPKFLQIGAGKFKMANLTFIKSLKIPLPPLAEQKRIVKKLDTLSAQIRALRTHQKAQLANLKSFKQSILHEAFSGEL